MIHSCLHHLARAPTKELLYIIYDAVVDLDGSLMSTVSSPKLDALLLPLALVDAELFKLPLHVTDQASFIDFAVVRVHVSCLLAELYHKRCRTDASPHWHGGGGWRQSARCRLSTTRQLEVWELHENVV